MRSISKLFHVAAADAAVIFCNNVTVTVFMCKFYFRSTVFLLFLIPLPSELTERL